MILLVPKDPEDYFPGNYWRTSNNLSTHLMLVLASPKKALPLSICGGLTSA